jgi:hypothetical protein
MPAYLVRIIDTHDIVGFFCADKMDELLVAIDECTEPVIASISSCRLAESTGDPQP